MPPLPKVEMNPVEQWLIRGTVTIIMALLIWIGNSVQTQSISISAMQTELQITRPADVLKALNDLKLATVSVAQISDLAELQLQLHILDKKASENEKRIERLEKAN